MIKFKNAKTNDLKDEIKKLNKDLSGTDAEKLFWEIHGQDYQQAPWRMGLNADHKKQGYTLQTFQRPQDNSPIDIIRMEARLFNMKKSDWFEGLKYGPPFKFAKTNVVKDIGENHRIIHVLMNPPIISQRESVIEWKRTDINEKESLLTIASTLSDEVPIKDNVLRTQILKC